MIMSEMDSNEELQNAEQILLKIGLLFQIQDDFLDCFGDPSIMGKVGTDIQEGKCCWPVVNAIDLCDDKQWIVLKDNYGLKNELNVKRVKEVYNELNLIHIYHKEEEYLYNEICDDIKQLKTKSALNPEIFESLLTAIYKRQK